MAKIYGVQMKAVKFWEAMEGYGCEANIYINNKKAGRYFDEGNGGEVDITINTLEHKVALRESADKYFEKYPIDKTDFDETELGDETFEEKYYYLTDEEAFLAILLDLYENEKFFKKKAKQGYTHMVTFEYPFFAKGPHPYLPATMFAGANPTKKVEEYVNEQKIKFPHLKYRIYSSEKDFIIE